jgi:hypothetical protein
MSRAMATFATLTLKGASGKEYSFDVYPNDLKWAAGIACVYYVSKRSDTGSHISIYVGETEDIKDRHLDHHKQECFERHGYNCISIHQERSANARLQTEKDLVKGLKPLCNE